MKTSISGDPHRCGGPQLFELGLRCCLYLGFVGCLPGNVDRENVAEFGLRQTDLLATARRSSKAGSLGSTLNSIPCGNWRPSGSFGS